MENKYLIKRLERWFRVTGPLITIILVVLLYNLLSDKKTISVIINTLSPFLFSFLIAWLLNPMVVALCDKFKMKRWMGTVIVIIGIVGVITLLIIWFVPQLTKQFEFLNEYLPNIIPDITENIEEFTYKININLDNEYIQSITEEITNSFSKLFSSSIKLITSSFSVVSGIVSAIFIGLMMLMAGIYILIDFDKFSAAVDSIVPSRFREDFEFLRDETNRVVIGYLRGLIIETIIVGALAYIAFLLLGIEGALVFGVIIGITNIIPYFGPYLGAIPVAVFALTDSVRLFMIVVVIVIVVQQIDGIVVKPKVFGKTTDVHPSISIIAIILFGRIFGFIGVIFAIPIAGFTIIIIKFIYKKLVNKYPEVLK
ncbi:MAG: AI-2E family transporter [Bacilli bacterium]